MRFTPFHPSSFDKQEFINHGAESTVWKGTIKEKVSDDIKLVSPLPLNRLVMRKKYKHPQDHERLVLEILQGLQYIIHMYGYSIDKKSIFLEVCETDLFEWRMERETISPILFWHIVEQLLEAIQACHKNNIVHTDIKLENIGIQKTDKELVDIRLFDFGQAVFVSNGDQEFETHLLQGSMHYTAPEVVGLDVLDRETVFGIDYWELGVVCYSLLMKCFPFNGKTAQMVRERIQTQTKLMWNKDIDAGCKAFTEALLTKHPHLRWNADKRNVSSFKKLTEPFNLKTLDIPE